ncbi:S-type pyocin domain-containing protein [Pseudomonas mandelii]|nr:S-type pyocin domain-containing protein [Pseudomonas mandelii]
MSGKHGPPHELPATSIVGQSTTIELPTTYIGKQPKPGKHPNGGGFSVPPTRPGGIGPGITYKEHLRSQTLRNVFATEKSAQNDYAAKSQDLPRATDVEFENFKTQYPAATATQTQVHQHELNISNILIQQKTAELHVQTGLANAFYGHSPLNATAKDYIAKVESLEKTVQPYGTAYTTWANSYKAAYSAKLLTEQIQLLNNKQVHVQNLLAAAHAQEQRQQAAEHEAQRVAAERARLVAEQEARRVAAEKARIQAEADFFVEAQAKAKAQLQAHLVQFEAQKRARIAALNTALAEAEAKAEAAAQHFAAEQARLQAEMEQRIEQIQKQQLTERQSMETRRKVIDTATAVAQRQAQLANLKIQQQREKQAQERQRQQTHLAAEAETQRQLEQARLLAQWREETEARWQSPAFANVGSMAAFGPTFTGTLGTVGVSPATSLALRSALRAAVSAAIATLASVAAPVLVGFAALMAPSRLGNGDLFSVSVPLSELAPDSTADLYELAAVGGEIDLPVRLGSRTIGNRVEIVVVTTDGVTVPASVPVRLAHFDARKNVYVSSSTVSNGPVITWTPLIEPQDPSTEFPLIDTDLPIYEGATVTPDTGRIDPFPELDRYGFGGFITVFPIDSGIPSTFTMFRDRRQDPGIASGAGEPVSGNWLGAASTGEGAPIPMQIADKFRGREFSSFKAFRRAFWKAVASDEYLFEQFDRIDKASIKHGLSPKPHQTEHVGQRRKYEIHHVTPIDIGGAVYDVDNLRILTPKQHIQTHSKKS